VRVTERQRHQIEARIRAAMDRLLRGELPPAGRCDVKTLAAAAAVTRNSLYTTYRHLKDEFEARRRRQREAGMIADPRQEQITRLKADNAALRERLAERDTTVAELTAFRTTALSQLAAQHEEILRLRQQIADCGNVHVLRSKPDDSRPRLTAPSSATHPNYPSPEGQYVGRR
jgi:chromosome segregation ATPase